MKKTYPVEQRDDCPKDCMYFINPNYMLWKPRKYKLRKKNEEQAVHELRVDSKKRTK